MLQEEFERRILLIIADNFMTVSIAQPQSIGRITSEKWPETDLEQAGLSLIEVQTRYFPGATQENHETPQSE
jgi:hypothetical protein